MIKARWLLTCALMFVAGISSARAAAAPQGLHVSIIGCMQDRGDKIQLTLLSLAEPTLGKQYLATLVTTTQNESVANGDLALPPGPYRLSAKTTHCNIATQIAIAQQPRSVWLALTEGVKLVSFDIGYATVKLPGKSASSMTTLLVRTGPKAEVLRPRVDDGVAYFDSVPPGDYILELSLNASRMCRSVNIPEASIPLDRSVSQLPVLGADLVITSAQLAQGLLPNAKEKNPNCPAR